MEYIYGTPCKKLLNKTNEELNYNFSQLTHQWKLKCNERSKINEDINDINNKMNSLNEIQHMHKNNENIFNNVENKIMKFYNLNNNGMTNGLNIMQLVMKWIRLFHK